MIGGVCILFEGCSEVLMFFSFLSFTSCIPVLWPFIDIHCTLLFTYIYNDDVYFFTYLYMCCFFFSLYICFFMYAIFMLVSHIMSWWVLFKCFRKIGCESLPCHVLSSCKFFREFMLGLDLFYILTNDYEFNDLRLLLWFICLLWFFS